MRGTGKTARVALVLVLGVAAFSGCQSSAQRRVATAPEPGLDGPGAAVVAAPARPASTVTFVDRHPLFSKPRDYYESSGQNKVVKVAAATVIGVPVGLFGELKQIVVGAPTAPKY